MLLSTKHVIYKFSLKSKLIIFPFSCSVQSIGNNRIISVVGWRLPSPYVCSILSFYGFCSFKLPCLLSFKLIKYYSTFLFISLWAVRDDFCHHSLQLCREGKTHPTAKLAHRPPTLWAVCVMCYAPIWVKNPTRSCKYCLKWLRSFYRGLFFSTSCQPAMNPLGFVSLCDIVIT